MGIDVDAVKLAAARAKATRQRLGNVEFRDANVLEWSEDTEYDLAYVRFLLTHLRDPGALSLRCGRRGVDWLRTMDQEGKELAAITLINIAEAVLAERLAGEAELQATITEARRVHARPGFGAELAEGSSGVGLSALATLARHGGPASVRISPLGENRRAYAKWKIFSPRSTGF